MRPSLPLLVLLLTTASLAGCLGSEEGLDPASLGAAAFTVAGPEGPLPFPGVSVLDAGGAPVATLSGGPNGTVALAALPPGAERVVVTATGHATWEGELPAAGETVELTPLPSPQSLAPDDASPSLRFLDPLLLGGAYLGDQQGSCQQYNCGGSEPTIEVAGDGSIYVSAVCCVGESPPIWVSRDGGQSFQLLEGDLLRDNFGIEGDFAIDDAGNLYFTDISVASAYISSWDAEGNHRWTVPAGPFKAPVDRPWVRAAGEDEVFFLYNAVTSTELYKSTDGGLTWLPAHSFDGALGAIGQGPERDHLWVTVQGTLFESTDAGQTWSAGEAVPTPTDEGDTFQSYWVPVVDEAGNLWVVYDWREGDEGPYHIYASRRDAGGSWHGPYQISPENGTHHLPWAATGRAGTLAVAWYGSMDDEAGPNDVDDQAAWHVFTAVSVDATSADPHVQRALADPLPVHEGPVNRKLLDFLQLDIGPDGAIHLAYAQDRDGRPDELTHYVRTTTGLQLQPTAYPNGPT